MKLIKIGYPGHGSLGNVLDIFLVSDPDLYGEMQEICIKITCEVLKVLGPTSQISQLQADTAPEEVNKARCLHRVYPLPGSSLRR